MIPAQSVHLGDGKVLRWDLGRDCSDVTQVKLRIAKNVGDEAVIDEVVAFDGDPELGIIKWTTTSAHFGSGKLTIGEWRVKVFTEPGPLTHPDNPDEPHGRLIVLDTISALVP